MSRACGFSLIELLVVILIAGILAALAIPRLADSEIKAAGYADQVTAAIRYAQRQAVAQHRSVYVCVAVNSVSIDYINTCAGATAQSGAIVQIPQQLLAPGNVTLAASTTPFSFNALGQPNPIGGVTVTLTGAGKTVNVTGETGYVFVN